MSKLWASLLAPSDLAREHVDSIIAFLHAGECSRRWCGSVRRRASANFHRQKKRVEPGHPATVAPRSWCRCGGPCRSVRVSGRRGTTSSWLCCQSASAVRARLFHASRPPRRSSISPRNCRPAGCARRPCWWRWSRHRPAACGRLRLALMLLGLITSCAMPSFFRMPSISRNLDEAVPNSTGVPRSQSRMSSMMALNFGLLGGPDRSCLLILAISSG